MGVIFLNDISLLHSPFVLINVWLPNLCDYKFIMIAHVILFLNEREIKKENKKRKRKKNKKKEREKNN